MDSVEAVVVELASCGKPRLADTLAALSLALTLAGFRGVAQLVEHWFPKPAVAGSSPSAPALAVVNLR